MKPAPRHYRRSKHGIQLVKARGAIREYRLRGGSTAVPDVPASKFAERPEEGLSLLEQLEYSISYATKGQNDDEI